jgi:hypothetical protein
MFIEEVGLGISEFSARKKIPRVFLRSFGACKQSLHWWKRLLLRPGREQRSERGVCIGEFFYIKKMGFLSLIFIL